MLELAMEITREYMPNCFFIPWIPPVIPSVFTDRNIYVDKFHRLTHIIFYINIFVCIR